MPRGGKNHAQGGGGIFAQDGIFLPPLANFTCTPLYVSNILVAPMRKRAKSCYTNELII